jgi:haloalkane dehalogenase
MNNKWIKAFALIAFGGFALTACMPQAAAPTPASAACKATPATLTTPQGVQFVRTPDACFQNLPDWNYEAKYVEIDGLRQAYAEVGPANGKPILLLHGQPSWSYLYRFMMPELAKNGYRVIAMDLLGMGRSDKPVNIEYHSFKNHVNRLEGFIKALNLTDLTVFAQDWGGVMAQYLAGTKPEIFARVILGNTVLPIITEPLKLPSDINASNAQFDQLLSTIPPTQPYFFDESGKPLFQMPEGASADIQAGAGQWFAYARYSKNFRASKIIEGGTFGPLTSDEAAAYDAPFPSEITMAGPRSFPSLTNQLKGLSEEARAGLKNYKKPFLTIFGANELGLPVEAELQQWHIANVPGASGQAHHRYRDAGHFLQDDKGQDIAVRIHQFMIKNAATK